MSYLKFVCFFLFILIHSTVNIFTLKCNDPNTYNIVYCTNDNYTIPTLVSMLSVVKNVKKGKKINFYIVVCKSSFSEYKLEAFTKFKNEYSSFCDVIIKKIDIYPEWIRRYYNILTSSWPIETCYRLLLPDLLHDIDKCLYLDSDTLICGDFSTLYDDTFDDKCILGVKDINFASHNQTLNVQTYINAGVMLMDLVQIRNTFRAYGGLDKAILDMLVSNEKICRDLDKLKDNILYFPDQNILNIVFNNKIKLVDKKYDYSGSLEQDQVIIHFYIGDKPWRNKKVKGAEEWWKCYNELYKKGYFWNGRCCKCCKCCKFGLS